MTTRLEHPSANASFATGIERHPERRLEEDQAREILVQGLVAHVGFVDQGLPYVIPMSYHYDAAEPLGLYLHGSLQSRALRLLATGVPACAEVTLLEGLVYSKAAMFHSLNYRSVLAFGKGAEITDSDHKQTIFTAMIARYFAGRAPGTDYVAAPEPHLDITLLVRLQIEALSAKGRAGGPKGPKDGRAAAAGSAGVADVPKGCPWHAQAEKGHGHV